MKKFFHILIQILLIIWQLPQCLVGLVMLPFLGKLEKIDYRNYCWCYKGSRMMGGISLGCFAFLSPYSATVKESVAHELDGHTVDSKIWGPLYLFVIGIPSILNAWLNITKCYYDFYPERWANKHANLEVDKYCRLRFKN